jgi:pyruvate dehydrogenase E2 component (dihydrolipoamide acetyltransferase)
MPEEIIMPKLGMTMESGVITKWYKKEGESVEEGVPVVEIMTDKANMDVEAQVSGILIKILAKEGEEVPVGKPIGIIKTPSDTDQDIEKILEKYKKITPDISGENLKEKITKPEIGIPEGEYTPATPLAKKIAKENRINIKDIGKGKAITSKDLIKRERTKIELTQTTNIMAQKMEESNRIPQFTLYYDIDAEGLIDINTKLKEKGMNASITAIIIKILASLLNDFPIFNSYFENGELFTREEKNIGVAVSTDKGLLVPILKNADKLNLPELFNTFNALIVKAREGKLSLSDIEGGSMTVSNLGMFGVDSFRALVVPKQSAIIAISAAKEKPVVIDKGIFVKKMMNVSISCDHRFIDGATAAEFMKVFKEFVEKDIEKVIIK